MLMVSLTQWSLAINNKKEEKRMWLSLFLGTCVSTLGCITSHRHSWNSHLCVPDVLQEYMSKARDMERELRNLTIEKTRAEALLEVSCNIYIIGFLMSDGLWKHR